MMWNNRPTRWTSTAIFVCTLCGLSQSFVFVCGQRKGKGICDELKLGFTVVFVYVSILK